MPAEAASVTAGAGGTAVIEGRSLRGAVIAMAMSAAKIGAFLGMRANDMVSSCQAAD
jgi:hypothetical protein